MSSVIILSSSPPPIFARSPTPVNLSRPRNSSKPSENGDTPGRNRFKTASRGRESFDTGFSTARQVLAEKNSDVNRNFTSSPGRNKFKATQTNTIESAGDNESEGKGSACAKHQASLPMSPQIHRGIVDLDLVLQERKRSLSPSPLIVQRAVSRRKDWTPPRSDTVHITHDADVQSKSSFGDDLFDSFGYKSTATSSKALVTGSGASKRRKIVDAAVESEDSVKALGIETQSLVSRKTSAKRSKSPNKKPLTITGLATSNFLSHEKAEPSAMLQYLTTTQKENGKNVTENGMFETKVKQTKAAVAKIRESKKHQPKSLLVSPSSALRYLEEQEAVFGSASQLLDAGRDPKQKDAIANGDPFAFSDPPSSPLQSQALSVESMVAHSGTTRFRQSRNLWAAAGRDEDNALLQIDTIDLTDSSAVRAALTGKDVMVQPNTAHPSTVSTKPSNESCLPAVQPKRATIFDINEVFPAAQNSRTFHADIHTTSRSSSPRKRNTTATDSNDIISKSVGRKSGKANNKKSAPKKPHYAGFSDHDLKKQISAYGFKAIKRREKMVELLEKCWVEKHGSESQAPPEPENEQSGYGDILSHIHDVSARPVPKAKKVAKPSKKKADAIKSSSTKKSAQSKTKSTEIATNPAAKTVVRKRKSKSNVVSDDRIYNIEDFDDPAVKERRELGRFDDWARPPRTPTVQMATTDLVGPETPPPSFPDTPEPAVQIPQASDEQARRNTSTKPMSTKAPEEALPTPSDTQQPNMLEQITRAINHESFTANVHIISPSKPSSSAATLTRRNHQTNPTWHEKILMYDPIILEDLAVWLNTKGLGDIGEDREVSAIDVRTWCESRGICCLWKGGWRGQKGSE